VVAKNMATNTNDDITTIAITFGGEMDANDRFSFANLGFGSQFDGFNPLNMFIETGSSTTSSVGGVTNISYTFSSATKSVKFSRTGGGAFTAAEVTQIETALKFATTSGAKQADRTVTFTHTDAFSYSICDSHASFFCCQVWLFYLCSVGKGKQRYTFAF
jgi:hypothetical protein